MLSRKYFDNLRQQQALSGRVDDPRAKDQNGAAPYDTDGTIFVSRVYNIIVLVRLSQRLLLACLCGD